MALSVRIRDQSRFCLHGAAVIGIGESTERNRDGRFTGSSHASGHGQLLGALSLGGKHVNEMDETL